MIAAKRALRKIDLSSSAESEYPMGSFHYPLRSPGSGDHVHILKIKSKQRTLEGENLVITKYKSEDEKVGFSQGMLDSNGKVFRMHAMIEHEGRFADDDGNIRPYYTIEGKQIDEDGEEVDFIMTVGNARLIKMLKRVMEGKKFSEKGHWIKVFSVGEGFKRRYALACADSREELENIAINDVISS